MNKLLIGLVVAAGAYFVVKKAKAAAPAVPATSGSLLVPAPTSSVAIKTTDYTGTAASFTPVGAPTPPLDPFAAWLDF